MPLPIDTKTFSTSTSTATCSIYGYVMDVKGKHVKWVRLSLKGVNTGTKKKTTTDANGFFEFEDLDADDYVIVAKKKGYRQGKKTVEVEEGKEKEIKIKLYAKL